MLELCVGKHWPLYLYCCRGCIIGLTNRDADIVDSTDMFSWIGAEIPSLGWFLSEMSP